MRPLLEKVTGHFTAKRSMVGLFLMRLAKKGYLWVPAFALMALFVLPLTVFSGKPEFYPASKAVPQLGETFVPFSQADQKSSEAVFAGKVPWKGEGSIKATLFQVLGGLGLFLFGLRLMSDGLQKVVGDRMKRVLATLTKRPLYGLILGTIVTGIMQSSSATTVMVVGLINAGLMDFIQSIGVILGANIGSTVLPQIVALNPDQLALPAIGFGMVLHLFFRNDRVKDSGLILLGFGMLFLGLIFMKTAIPAEAQEIIQKLFLISSGGLKGVLIGLAIGAIATAIVQASGITVGIIVLLASQGMVADLKAAVPLILGCNIGTCVTALVASIGTDAESKRAAVSHTFFNVFGAFLTLVVFYPFYLWLIPRIGGSLAHQIANLHVMVKLVDALLFLPIVGPFSRFIAWVVPAKVIEQPGIETPRYLDDKFVEEPVVAIELAIKEIVRLGEISRNMIKYAMDGFMYNDEALLDRVEAYRKAVRSLREAISRYVIQISQQDLSKEEAERVPKLILSVNNFDRVAGHAVRLLELGRTKVSKNIPLVGSALNELKNIYREVDTMLTEVSGYLPEFKR
ncbi:MAG: Na/Pi cotransporter family protein [Deltaproteobacteria bacterium]|nr:Na/Pi cotransporter family protein [Deltaproteobacteria bacterium]MBW2073538.1 Na/Pi cotransporter family protein [Deltaproteobacteria bacterium]